MSNIEKITPEQWAKKYKFENKTINRLIVMPDRETAESYSATRICVRKINPNKWLRLSGLLFNAFKEQE